MEIAAALVDLIMHKLDTTEARARFTAGLLLQNEDLMDEFVAVIMSGCFPDEEKAVHIEGRTARDVKAHFGYFNLLGVYNYMLSLRYDPKTALRYWK